MPVPADPEKPPGEGRAAAPGRAATPDHTGFPDLESFAEMFAAHAAHLFDYCSGLVDADEAAQVTQAALTSAQSLLQDPGRLRAWLFALARRQIAATSAADPGQEHYVPLAQMPEFAADDAGATDPGASIHSSPAVQAGAAYRSLGDRHREVLDLVYRHHIQPADLPPILGVSAEEATAELAEAEAAFERSDETEAARVDEIAALPLAQPPAALWRRAARAVLESGPRPDDDRPPRSPSPWQRLAADRRIRLAALAAIPVAAVAAAALYIADPMTTTSADNPRAVIAAGGALPTAAGGPLVGAAEPSPAAAAKKRPVAPNLPVTGLFPGVQAPAVVAPTLPPTISVVSTQQPDSTPAPTTSPKPSASATTTSKPPSVPPTTAPSTQPTTEPTVEPTTQPPPTQPPTTQPTTEPTTQPPPTQPPPASEAPPVDPTDDA